MVIPVVKDWKVWLVDLLTAQVTAACMVTGGMGVTRTPNGLGLEVPMVPPDTPITLLPSEITVSILASAQVTIPTSPMRFPHERTLTSCSDDTSAPPRQWHCAKPSRETVLITVPRSFCPQSVSVNWFLYVKILKSNTIKMNIQIVNSVD